MKTSETGKRILARAALGLIVIIMVFAGCTKTQQVLVREPASPSPGVEGRWDLVSYGPAGSEATVLTDSPIFIDFTSDGKISGSGGCNRYFGGWGILEGTKDTIRIWRTGSTKMACPGPIMTQEHHFLEELSRASRYETEGKELRLYYDEGRGVLRFSRGVNP
ncbi:MAG TPA: META domain-containing protein [Syntrophales bacterium]